MVCVMSWDCDIPAPSLIRAKAPDLSGDCSILHVVQASRIARSFGRDSCKTPAVRPHIPHKMPAAVAMNGSSEGRQVKRQRTTQDSEAVVKSQRQVGSSRLFAPYRVTSSFAPSYFLSDSFLADCGSRITHRRPLH